MIVVSFAPLELIVVRMFCGGTMLAFVNATAWISHRENHHPDIELGYNRVTLRYTTHAANGLTENDFICAAKVDALLTL